MSRYGKRGDLIIHEQEPFNAETGLAALHNSFRLAYRTGDIEGVVRAATNHMYLLYSAGRSAEALDVARSGRRAARSLDAPAALTSVLDNNTAAVRPSAGRADR